MTTSTTEVYQQVQVEGLSQVEWIPQIEGLQTIYARKDRSPQVTFLFESTETAQIIQQRIADSVSNAYVQGVGTQSTDTTTTNLLEVLQSEHLVTCDNESRLLSYRAKSFGTIGVPIKSVEDLLAKLRQAMRILY